MKEDKVLRKIHQTQARFYKEHKGLSWNEEAKLIGRVAKKVAKQYNYTVFPVAKTPYLLRDKSQKAYQTK